MQTLSWNNRVIEWAPTWAHAAEREVPAWEIADKALRSIAKRRGALDAEEAGWLLRARDTQVHRHLGLSTFVAYLELVLGYGPRAAQERVRVAEALAILPRMKEQLAKGLAFSAVRELTRVALPDTEAQWLDATEGKNLREIEQMVSGHKPGDFPDSPPDPALIEHVLHFQVSAQTKALFREAMRKLRQDAGQHLSEAAASRSRSGPRSWTRRCVTPSSSAGSVATSQSARDGRRRRRFASGCCTGTTGTAWCRDADRPSTARSTTSSSARTRAVTR